MHIKLQILPTQTSQDSAIRKYVKVKQENSKAYIDAKRRARIPSFRPGDKMRLKKSFLDFFLKTDSKFSHPIMVHGNE